MASTSQPPSAAAAAAAYPQSLRAAYAAAEAQREAIERGAFAPGGNSTTTSYGDAVAKALDAYQDCAKKVEALSLFSSNESAEDISTSHLPYLLLPYRVAELVQRIPPSLPIDMSQRRRTLQRARDAYERFLHSLDSYGLLTRDYSRILEDLDAYVKSTAAMDPTTRRNAKIANFRMEKELKTKLEVLKQRQNERRERQRRQRDRLREAGEEVESEGNEENEEEDDDDESARELYLAQLSYLAHLSFQGIESIAREDEMLAQMPALPMPQGGPSAGGLGDNRDKDREKENYSDRLDNVGGSNIGRGGPLLTKEGKPRQPFTILGSRADMAKSVFRPGHNLPTMSIDEYLEEERKRGGIIEGGGPSSGLAPEPDEDNMEKADAETMKAREWDEFVEANPKGAGNTLNRG